MLFLKFAKLLILLLLCTASPSLPKRTFFTIRAYGELNQLSYQGKGFFVCISPWNFPLAIFLGQIAAALVTGNTVIAKPSHLTPRIAAFTVNLAYQAGIPKTLYKLFTCQDRSLAKRS